MIPRRFLGPRPEQSRACPRGRRWAGCSSLSVAVSLVAAGLWRGRVRTQEDQAFGAQAASVGSPVTTALRRIDDLAVVAPTLIA